MFNCIEQLMYQEGIAADRSAQLNELNAKRSTEANMCELKYLIRAEFDQRQVVPVRLSEFTENSEITSRGYIPRRHRQEQPEIDGPAGENTEGRDAIPICPVRVLDDED